jgi:hypothetical protein
VLPSVIVTPVTNPPAFTIAVPVAAAPETAVKLSPAPLAVAATLIFNAAEYVNERVFCVELAAALKTNCVPFVIDEITAFAGTPEAVIIIPTANPAVEAAFTDVDPDVKEIPPNVSVPPEPFAVAFALITNFVPSVTDTTVAPFGIAVPLTGIPTANPSVLVTVTVEFPDTVTIPPTVAVAIEPP